ncbi:putative hydroxymethyltransferase [Salmonella enterica subsp. enterica serovar Daytona]|uniref:Putative hydroxymethyltransferase n=1 Tax=Salmonella enterica subsp. enterica serovar Daytona TaxID=1962639 RepID=A0A447JNY0_SALET|nr:putative hydroxymethyltransferase [Salmonella enterica subsp. enterica serovar Daytona]
MNHAAISFTASGHIDPWGNSGGTLKGNLPLTLNESSYGTLETNNIIINNSDALLLQPGERGTLSFSLRGDAGAGKNVRHHLDAGVIVIRRRRV